MGRRLDVSYGGLMDRTVSLLSREDYDEFADGLASLPGQYAEEGKATGHVAEKRPQH